MSNKKRVIKLLILIIFLVGSILVGLIWSYVATTPMRLGNDPYLIGTYNLYTYSDLLENEQVVMTRPIDNVQYEASSDILTLEFINTEHDFVIVIIFRDWSKHEKFGMIVSADRTYTIKGVSRLNSEGIVVGIDIVEINSIVTNSLSIVGLAIIVPLILYYFKIDFKEFKLISRNKRSHGGDKQPA